jgi:hypothetical protein
MVVVVLHDAARTVAARRRGGEVAPVGGAVEKQIDIVFALVQFHRPRHVYRRPAVVEGDAKPVYVGVQVRAELAAAQPHVVAVMELLHRSARWRWRVGSWFLGAPATGRRWEAKAVG